MVSKSESGRIEPAWSMPAPRQPRLSGHVDVKDAVGESGAAG